MYRQKTTNTGEWPKYFQREVYIIKRCPVKGHDIPGALKKVLLHCLKSMVNRLMLSESYRDMLVLKDIPKPQS